MTEPVKLPERNEILKLLRTKAEICRTEWLRSERGDIYNSAVIMEFAQAATPGNILVLLDYVAELTRQVERLKQQLQGATANEQSMVEQTAHNRDQLALVVKQKDDISVKNAALVGALSDIERDLEARLDKGNLHRVINEKMPAWMEPQWGIVLGMEARAVAHVGRLLLLVRGAISGSERDALSVANQDLREKTQGLLDAWADFMKGGRNKYATAGAADALRKAIADTQEGQTGKTVTGKVVMVTGAGLASLIENCQHGPIKFCLLELQQLRASHAALEQAQAGKEPK